MDAGGQGQGVAYSDERGGWHYCTSVRLHPTVPQAQYKSEVKVTVPSTYVHTETLKVTCEPKMERTCTASLTSGGKVTNHSQHVEYSTQYTPTRYTCSEIYRNNPVAYTSGLAIKLEYPYPKLTEVYHSKAIHGSSCPEYLQISTTKVISRHLSERNTDVFEADSSQSFLCFNESLESMFSEDSSADDQTMVEQTPQYRSEVLILGLSSKQRRYAGTKRPGQGILKTHVV